VSLTAAVVADKLYSDEEWRWFRSRRSTGRSAWQNRPCRATIRSADTVLDLGCGGGIDTILAAHRTGPTGRAIALGFLPEMVTRTADACAESVCPTWSRWRVSWRPFRCRTTVT
jgi:arsenite methyltransferase